MSRAELLNLKEFLDMVRRRSRSNAETFRYAQVYAGGAFGCTVGVVLDKSVYRGRTCLRIYIYQGRPL